MKNKINYMFLVYYPHLVDDHAYITVGIVVHDQTNRTCRFIYWATYHEMHQIDPDIDYALYEADINTFIDIFQYPKVTPHNFFTFDDIEKNNFLKERELQFSNEYQFTEPQTKLMTPVELLEFLRKLEAIHNAH